MDLTAYVSHLGHVIKFDLISGPAQPTHDSEESIFSASEKQAVELQATSFRFSSERCFKMETQSRTHAMGHEGAERRIVLAKCVRESHTGLILPCVLVQSRRSAQDFVTSLFLYALSSNRIFLHGEVTSKYAIPRDNVRLTDGPAACWRVDELNRFLIAKKDAESKRFGLNVCLDDSNAKVMQSSMMYCTMSPDSNLHIITIPKIKVSADDDSIAWRWISLISNSKQKCHFTNSHYFVPDVYASIACCMLLTIHEQENVSLGDQEPHEDHLSLQQLPAAVPLKNTAYVATSMKQLLEFKNGVFCKLTSIPFDDAVKIVPMETRGEKMVVVRSRGGAVCVISCTSFKVIQEWKNILCLFVDDILGNGRDQLLMLLNPCKDTPYLQPLPDFILTDLDLCHITSSDQLLLDGKGQRSDDGQSAPTPRSLVTAMQSLEAKVENGLTALREQELSKRLKDRIISQSMENLVWMAAGISNPIQRQPTLVHLCGSTPSHPLLASTPGIVTHGRLKVTVGWQRIVNEKWVIGCKVTNENQWAVSNVKLLVLPWKTNSSQEPVECEGSFQHSMSRGTNVDGAETGLPEYHLAPPSKRSKLEDMGAKLARDCPVTLASSSSSSSSSLTSKPAGRLPSLASPLEPGESCDALATTTIPEFLEGPVASRLLVLQWTNHRPFPQGEQSRSDRRKVLSVICGHVCLTAADVIGSKLAVKLPEIHPTLVTPPALRVISVAGDVEKGVLSRKDELAMDASQHSTSLRVTSRYTHLPNLHRVLFQDMGFQEIGGDKCCNCTIGVLRGARVYLENVRSNSAQLRLCTRDKRELMLFFHTLKSCLPADVQFTSDPPLEHIEDAITQSVISMNNELHHMQKITNLACSTATGVNQHDKDGEGNDETPMEEGGGSDSISHERDRLKRLREEFLKQQQTAKSKECTLADNHAETLRFKLLELRENTDNAITVLSRCI